MAFNRILDACANWRRQRSQVRGRARCENDLVRHSRQIVARISLILGDNVWARVESFRWNDRNFPMRLELRDSVQAVDFASPPRTYGEYFLRLLVLFKKDVVPV